MRKFAIYAGTAMLVTMLCGNVEAGAVDLLTRDGINDFLEDDDYESFVDAGDGMGGGPDGIVNAGDFVVGMFSMQAINGTPTPTFGSTFEGILVAKVTGVSGSATSFGGFTFGGETLTFGAVSGAEYTSLKTTHGWTNLPTRMSDDSALIVYDDMTGSPFVDPDGAGAGVAGANDALLTAVNAAPQILEFGFTGSTFSFASVSDGTSAPPLGSFTFSLGLNNTFNGIGGVGGLSFAKIDLDGAGPLPGVDLLGTGSVDLFKPKGDFDVATDADFIINPVPEPGSMTLLGLGALGLLGVRMRRKNAA